MYRQITQKLNSLFSKNPKGHVSISAENASGYMQSYQGKAYTYQEQYTASSLSATSLNEHSTDSFFQDFSANFNAIYLESSHPAFRFCQNQVIDPQDQFINHASLNEQSTPTPQQLPTRYKKLAGTIAYLSHTHPHNYGQWMQIILPLLRVYQKHVSIDEIDYFYIGDVPQVPHFVLECFDLLGIPRQKIVNFPCRGNQTLIALTESVSEQTQASYDAYSFVRHVITSQVDLSHNCCYNPFVYITRGATQKRQVKNQEAVFEVLRPYDIEFRVLDQLSILEQAQIFYHANTIIAPHGAALTNLMFGKKDSKVLEIFPHNYLSNRYFSLATYAGLPYYYMQGNKHSSPTPLSSSDEAIEVNLALLNNFCKAHC